MDLAALEQFIGVAGAGSFAEQARRQQVAASSISRQIAALEQHLGFCLFDRSTRRLQLTEAGQTYLDRVTPLLQELQAAGAAAQDVVRVPSGRLTVASSIGFAERWLIPRLSGFQARHPGIQIDLQLSDAAQDLRGEQVDLALRIGAEMAGDYVSRILMPCRYHVVASPCYLATQTAPKTPAELTAHRCLLFPYPGFQSLWRFRHNDDLIAEVTPGRGSVISNALALRRAALEGLGVALLADWTIAEDLQSGRLIDLFPGYACSAGGFDSAVWILYPSRAYVPVKLRVFIDWLVASARSEPLSPPARSE